MRIIPKPSFQVEVLHLHSSPTLPLLCPPTFSTYSLYLLSLHLKSKSKVEVEQRNLSNFSNLSNPTTQSPNHELLSAFARDTGPAADAIAKLLKDPSKEAAEKLLGDIDKLLPSDPAMAAVIAEAMAAEFGVSLENEDPDDIFYFFNEDREKDGKFAIKGTGNQTGSKIENSIEKRQRECREALDAYNASTDHPSADDVLAGKISVEDALAKGFEVKFGGQKIIFFTSLLGDHYDNPTRPEQDIKRLALVKRAIAERNKLMPGRHYDNQIVLMSQKHLEPREKKLVVIADASTGVARSIMMSQQNYCDSHFKLWGRK